MDGFFYAIDVCSRRDFAENNFTDLRTSMEVLRLRVDRDSECTGSNPNFKIKRSCLLNFYSEWIFFFEKKMNKCKKPCPENLFRSMFKNNSFNSESFRFCFIFHPFRFISLSFYSHLLTFKLNISVINSNFLLIARILVNSMKV